MEKERDPRRNFRQQGKVAPPDKETEAERLEAAREALKGTGSRDILKEKREQAEADTRRQKPL